MMRGGGPRRAGLLAGLVDLRDPWRGLLTNKKKTKEANLRNKQYEGVAAASPNAVRRRALVGCVDRSPGR